MPATSKAELLEVTRRDYAKLAKLIQPIDGPRALAKDDDDTSIKDVVAHRAHWIELFLGWYRDGQAGAPVHLPAEGYKWNELKRYNADLRARQADMTWPEARTALEAGYDTLVGFMELRSEEELYGGPMKGGKNPWTTGRWAEAAGPSHFRSAAKYIRARLRVLG